MKRVKPMTWAEPVPVGQPRPKRLPPPIPASLPPSDAEKYRALATVWRELYEYEVLEHAATKDRLAIANEATWDQAEAVDRG